MANVGCVDSAIYGNGNGKEWESDWGAENAGHEIDGPIYRNLQGQSREFNILLNIQTPHITFPVAAPL